MTAMRFMTYLILKYSGAGDNLKLDKTGEGDIKEMCEALGDDEAAYAYIRMKLGNDEYSERVKFAFVIWAGKTIFSFFFPKVATLVNGVIGGSWENAWL